MSRWIYPGIIGWLICQPILATAIELHSIDQTSLHSSDWTEVTLTGKELRDNEGNAASLWCSQKATVEVLDPESTAPGRVRYRIRPETQFGGLVAIRVFDKQSISRAFLLAASEKLASPIDSGIQQAATPGKYFGSTKNLGSFELRVPLTEGQPFVAEILGERLGSDLDAVMILHDPHGQEVAYADDHILAGSDPILTYKPSISGNYRLILHDVEYRGGQRFELRLGSQQSSVATFPAAIRIGETRFIQYGGFGELSGIHGDVFTASQLVTGLHYVPSNQWLASVNISTLPVYLEANGPMIPIPAILCGRLEKPGELDVFHFHGNKGQRLRMDFLEAGTITGIAKLYAGDQRLATQNEAVNRTAKLQIELPENGQYRLEISDLLGRGNPGFTYALSIRDDQTTATLRIADSKNRKLRPNELHHRFQCSSPKSIPFQIRIDRRGLVGAVEIKASCSGVPCPVTGDLEADKNEGEISVDVSRIAANGKPLQLRLWGETQKDGLRRLIPLDLTESLSKDYPRPSRLPATLTQTIAVLVPEAAGEDKTE